MDPSLAFLLDSHLESDKSNGESSVRSWFCEREEAWPGHLLGTEAHHDLRIPG